MHIGNVSFCCVTPQFLKLDYHVISLKFIPRYSINYVENIKILLESISFIVNW